MIVLDLRDKDEYKKTHIKGAIHYPAPMLSRSVNEYIYEIYQFV